MLSLLLRPAIIFVSNTLLSMKSNKQNDTETRAYPSLGMYVCIDGSHAVCRISLSFRGPK